MEAISPLSAREDVQGIPKSLLSYHRAVLSNGGIHSISIYQMRLFRALERVQIREEQEPIQQPINQPIQLKLL